MSEIDNLPNVDLSSIIDELKPEVKPDEGTPQAQPAQKAEPEELDLGQFKNPKDLLKSYKEIQAAFTRVTQENKTAKQREAELKEQLEMMKPPVQQQQQHQPQQKFDEAFLQDPEGAISQTVQRSIATARIAEVLEDEADKNRDEFNERYAYAQAVAREYPHLATTASGVKKLFQHGDKLRTEQLRKNAGRALESIFGEPLGEEEIARLRTIVKGDKGKQTNTNNNLDAYMPDTSTSTRSGSDADRKPDNALKMKQAVERGDVDGVIKTMFDGLMAE